LGRRIDESCFHSCAGVGVLRLACASASVCTGRWEVTAAVQCARAPRWLCWPYCLGGPIYLSSGYNFCRSGRKRTYVYGCPVDFLALLYLALIRRSAHGWPGIFRPKRRRGPALSPIFSSNRCNAYGKALQETGASRDGALHLLWPKFSSKPAR